MSTFLEEFTVFVKTRNGVGSEDAILFTKAKLAEPSAAPVRG